MIGLEIFDDEGNTTFTSEAPIARILGTFSVDANTDGTITVEGFFKHIDEWYLYDSFYSGPNFIETFLPIYKESAGVLAFCKEPNKVAHLVSVDFEMNGDLYIHYEHQELKSNDLGLDSGDTTIHIIADGINIPYYTLIDGEEY